MISSMTGFATRKGQAQGHAWVWEIRSVNGKGLDLRLRVPDWIEGLEPALRSDLGKALQRGSVSLSLKVAAEGGAEGLRVNIATLQAVLRGLSEVEAAARGTGLTLAPPTAAEVLAQRGVLEQGAGLEDTAPLRAALLADLPALLADFHTMRRAEGAALDRVIRAQLDRIEALTAEAATEAEARRTASPLALRENLARLLAASEGLDETRIAQELALLAVKQDVTEELDRLGAHVAAARALLDETAPVGRRLDFLVQEFMREANTLCSKAQSMELTRVGLDLKTVIDQMREQIQNVE
ncbi:YicC family protein [Cereibacter sphaeroides]|uniref:YicC/YloC family endoribonuclease n=1 Tax=Cereibacter sphaeroides TaxID=1063 RepID=UPI001F175580|nr:YicC/YloC family endoribonuclease [Cereibacter sphaeroides]MCE6962046.1 YicC family protein [Cereibacter sphaeroides]MCE6975583.1 YicC family protein [Cereibacter sphaeroides]